jgi:release factor glutamine methyltransferase
VTPHPLPEHEIRRLRAVARDEAHLRSLVERRLDGEPLQYLERTAAFAYLDLVVDERVLVPRPETEGLYELACRLASDPKVIVDLCTGSGALALSLKQAFPAAEVHATDISADALDVARLNAGRTGLEVSWHQGDLFEPLPDSLRGKVDLLVANPPYVAEHEFEDLPVDVKREPRVALIAGPTGLEIVERIGAEAARWLKSGGVVIVEIGETQGEAAAACFDGIPAEVRKDLAGKDRYVVGVRP